MKLENFSLLYVEDDIKIRESFVDLLEAEVRELFVATNGEEGLELYKKSSPDIVLTDIVMPVMDGLQMAKQIKNINYSQPVILLTSHSDNEILKSSLNIGIDRYVTKPILDLDNFLETLEDVGKLAIPNIDPFEMMKQSTISMLLITNDHLISHANLAFSELYGYTEDDVVGKKTEEFFFKDDVAESEIQAIRSAFEEKESATIIVRSFTKEGELLYVELSISPIFRKGTREVQYFLTIHKDVT
jgi:two-component system cell cycle response regulator